VFVVLSLYHKKGFFGAILYYFVEFFTLFMKHFSVVSKRPRVLFPI